MKLRDLYKTNSVNSGNRTLNESILIPEVNSAFEDWKSSTKGLEYVLIGGIALSYYTKPRTTTDVDTLFPNVNDIPLTINNFKKHRSSAFQHNATHVEIEVLTPALINMTVELAKSIYKNANVIDGVRIATPSGLIAAKLLRFKLQDQADIESLLELGNIDLTPYPLDKKYLDRYEDLITRLKN